MAGTARFAGQKEVAEKCPHVTPLDWGSHMDRVRTGLNSTNGRRCLQRFGDTIARTIRTSRDQLIRTTVPVELDPQQQSDHVCSEYCSSGANEAKRKTSW